MFLKQRLLLHVGLGTAFKTDQFALGQGRPHGMKYHICLLLVIGQQGTWDASSLLTFFLSLWLAFHTLNGIFLINRTA
jgi:hypothetical protein